MRSGDDDDDDDGLDGDGRDSLALSSYLLLRKRGKLSEVASNVSQTTPKAPRLQNTPDLTHHFSISNILASPLTPIDALFPFHDEYVRTPAQGRSDSPFSGPPTFSTAAPTATLMHDDENLDVTGLKLLLRTALRDKEVTRHRLEATQDEIIRVRRENEEILHQSTVIHSIAENVRKWKLPLLLFQKITEKHLLAKMRALGTWFQGIKRKENIDLREKNRDLILLLARRNILKQRERVQQRFLLRWKLKIKEADNQMVVLAHIVQKQQQKHRLREVFHVMYKRMRFHRWYNRHRIGVRQRSLRRGWSMWLVFYRKALAHSSLEEQRQYSIAGARKSALVRHWQLRHNFAHLKCMLFQKKLRDLCHQRLGRCMARALTPLRQAFRRWKKMAYLVTPKQETQQLYLRRLLHRKQHLTASYALRTWRQETLRQRAALLFLRKRSVGLYNHRVKHVWNCWTHFCTRSHLHEVQQKHDQHSQQVLRFRLWWVLHILKQRMRTSFVQWQYVTYQHRQHSRYQQRLKQYDEALQGTRAHLQQEHTAKKDSQVRFQTTHQQLRHQEHRFGAQVVGFWLLRLRQRQVARAFRVWQGVQTAAMHYQAQRHLLVRTRHQEHQHLTVLCQRMHQHRALRQILQTWHHALRRRKNLRQIIQHWQLRHWKNGFRRWYRQTVGLRLVAESPLRRVYNLWRRCLVTPHWQRWQEQTWRWRQWEKLGRKVLQRLGQSTLQRALQQWRRYTYLHRYQQDQRLQLSLKTQTLRMERTRIFLHWRQIARRRSHARRTLQRLLQRQQHRDTESQRLAWTRWFQHCVGGPRQRQRILLRLLHVYGYRGRLRQAWRHWVYQGHRIVVARLAKLSQRLSQTSHHLGSVHEETEALCQVNQDLQTVAQRQELLLQHVRWQLSTELAHRRATEGVRRCLRHWQRYHEQHRRDLQKISTLMQRRMHRTMRHWKAVHAETVLDRRVDVRVEAMHRMETLRQMLLKWRHFCCQRRIALQKLVMHVGKHHALLQSLGWQRWRQQQARLKRDMRIRYLYCWEQWTSYVTNQQRRRKCLQQLLQRHRMWRPLREGWIRWQHYTSDGRLQTLRRARCQQLLSRLLVRYCCRSLQQSFGRWRTQALQIQRQEQQRFALTRWLHQRPLQQAFTQWRRHSILQGKLVQTLHLVVKTYLLRVREHQRHFFVHWRHVQAVTHYQEEQLSEYMRSTHRLRDHTRLQSCWQRWFRAATLRHLIAWPALHQHPLDSKSLSPRLIKPEEDAQLRLVRLTQRVTQGLQRLEHLLVIDHGGGNDPQDSPITSTSGKQELSQHRERRDFLQVVQEVIEEVLHSEDGRFSLQVYLVQDRHHPVLCSLHPSFSAQQNRSDVVDDEDGGVTRDGDGAGIEDPLVYHLPGEGHVAGHCVTDHQPRVFYHSPASASRLFSTSAGSSPASTVSPLLKSLGSSHRIEGGVHQQNAPKKRIDKKTAKEVVAIYVPILSTVSATSNTLAVAQEYEGKDMEEDDGEEKEKGKYDADSDEEVARVVEREDCLFVLAFHHNEYLRTAHDCLTLLRDAQSLPEATGRTQWSNLSPQRVPPYQQTHKQHRRISGREDDLAAATRSLDYLALTFQVLGIDGTVRAVLLQLIAHCRVLYAQYFYQHSNPNVNRTVSSSPMSPPRRLPSVLVGTETPMIMLRQGPTMSCRLGLGARSRLLSSALQAQMKETQQVRTAIVSLEETIARLAKSRQKHKDSEGALLKEVVALRRESDSWTVEKTRLLAHLQEAVERLKKYKAQEQQIEQLNAVLRAATVNRML